MKKVMTKLLNKMGVKKMKRLKNNNKGFSLIELLIVIAIMGVLAAIAFNMFGGVLGDSKKKADKQQGANIEKALLTYMIESDDWDLTAGKVGGAAIGTKDEEVIQALLQEIVNESTGIAETYGPMLSLKYPEDNATDDKNWKAYMPQSPENIGWKINSYATKQVVTVVPAQTDTECVFKSNP